MFSLWKVKLGFWGTAKLNGFCMFHRTGVYSVRPCVCVGSMLQTLSKISLYLKYIWYGFLLLWRCRYFQITFLIILWVKINIFIPKWLFRGVNWIQSFKIGDFDSKRVRNTFKIICLFTAVKNQTSNFADTCLGPDYWIFSNVIQEISETLGKVLVSTTFDQSRPTTFKFLSLKESESLQPSNF